MSNLYSGQQGEVLMESSFTLDSKQYLQLLHRFISEHNLINDPKHLKSLVTISRNKQGELLGWIIDDKKIIFSNSEILKCNERAGRSRNEIIIKRFSYHFNPNGNPELLSYRIDHDNKGVHLNPDPSLEREYGHRLLPDNISLNIHQFHCLFALHLALQYIRQKEYPAFSGGEVYNTILEGLRRQIHG